MVGESRAGHPFAGALEAGEAIRISTGAVVPEGAATVVPVERTETAGGRVDVGTPEEGANIRRAGEDVRAGATVLTQGTELGPAEVGVLASVGRGSATCARRPRVAVLATGDELAPPGAAPEPGRIWSSNPLTVGAPGDPRRRRGGAERDGAGLRGGHSRSRSRARSPTRTSSASRAACRWASTTT